MGTLCAPARTLWALALALLLGLRLLAPAGFMPAFDRGAVTIIACPGSDTALVATGHHHSADHKTLHQPCPYAAASALGALPDAGAPLAAVLLPAAALLLGQSLPSIARNRTSERPPATGPPLLT
jgi:hypothetical protein